MKHQVLVLTAGALVVAALILAGPFSVAQRGAIVAPTNVGQLTTEAQTIIRGRVIRTSVERHPELSNLNTVVITLKVDETLKGTSGPTYTFRQFIWDIRDRVDAAGYRKGQEYLLMLNAPSRYGLTSPAGLEQGRFRILRDRSGNVMALNGYDNFGLFRGLDSQAEKSGIQLSSDVRTLGQKHTHGAVPLDDLRTAIKQFGRAQ